MHNKPWAEVLPGHQLTDPKLKKKKKKKKTHNDAMQASENRKLVRLRLTFSTYEPFYFVN